MIRNIHRRSLGLAGRAALIALLALLIATVAATTASAGPGQNGNGQGGSSPMKVVEPDELRKAKDTPIDEIIRNSKPLEVKDHGNGNGHERKQGPDGPEESYDGAEPALATAGAVSSVLAATQNGAWTGSYASNPNKQVGKLYFWTGTRWSHCSATAINSENKSLVLTAGHCVYNPDPDENSKVDGNGYWYSGVQFCPGYEFGCKLGVWYAKTLHTTNSWFYGSGAARNYDWSDDVAVVLVSPHPTKGKLVNAVGGQGISFNWSTGRTRHALGYPLDDWRFPAYTYGGEDLMYCPGVDTYDGYGHINIACTMTGGASGGPWITSPASNWIGYVNSVNSHKPSGPTMGGPYFGAAEKTLFTNTRSLQ